MEAAIFDDLTVLGDAHPQPDARPARTPRADGRRAVRGAPAAAVDGQPSSEGAGRRGLGDVQAGRHQPLLQLERAAARDGRKAVVASARAGRRHVSRRSGRPAAEERDDAPADRLAAVLRIGRRPLGQAPRGDVRTLVPSSGADRAARRALDGRRPRLWDGARRGGARAVRRPRDRGRSFRRHAAGGTAPAARFRPTSKSAAASSNRCRSTTPRSTPPR